MAYILTDIERMLGSVTRLIKGPLLNLDDICFIRSFFLDPRIDISPWMLICRHIASFNWDVRAAAVRALLTVGVDLTPSDEDLVDLKDLIEYCASCEVSEDSHAAQSTQLTEIVEFLKEKFPDDIFMSGFLQATYFECSRPWYGIRPEVYLGIQGTFIYQDMVPKFAGKYKNLSASEKKMIRPLSIIRRSSRKVIGTISGTGETDMQVTIGDLVLSTDTILRNVDLGELLDFLEAVEKEAFECRRDKKMEYMFLLRDEHGSAPLDLVAHTPMVKQGKNGMCKETTLAMAGCGVAILPSTIKVLVNSCACMRPRGSCGEYTMWKITEKTPYSFVNETLYALKKVRETLAGAGVKSLMDADEETQKKVFKFVEDGKKSVAKLSRDNVAKLEKHEKDLRSKKLEQALKKLFIALRAEELKARITLKEAFRHGHLFLEGNASFFKGESEERGRICTEAFGFLTNPPQELQKTIRVIRLCGQ